jgi:hypothetical protein
MGIVETYLTDTTTRIYDRAVFAIYGRVKRQLPPSANPDRLPLPPLFWLVYSWSTLCTIEQTAQRQQFETPVVAVNWA